MLDFLLAEGHFTHTLAALILVGRLGDVGSTLLIAPAMGVEANPLVRRFRLLALVPSLAVALVPYFSTALGMVVLVPSLLVTSHNLARGWLYHGLGQEEMLALFERVARRSTRVRALGFTIGAGTALALAAGVLLLLSGGPGTWAFAFALGMLLYAFALTMHTSLFALRLFRRVEGA